MERLSQPKLGPATEGGAPKVNPGPAPELTSAEKVAAEVARRRRLITSGRMAPYQEGVNAGKTQAELEGLGRRADGAAGFEDVAPDAADLALRDLQTGRVSRRARRGASSSALGSFAVTSALGADSLLGS